ncbi:TPA: hypothetical protein ACICB7_004471, partial [Klebsiella aerogenes]
MLTSFFPNRNPDCGFFPFFMWLIKTQFRQRYSGRVNKNKKSPRYRLLYPSGAYLRHQHLSDGSSLQECDLTYLTTTLPTMSLEQNYSTHH